MREILERIWESLVGRSTGPMNFRLIIQPLVAIMLAVRAGLADARQGRPAFVWTAIANPAYRPELLRQGWKDVGKIFAIAVVLDSIYQLIVLRGVYVGELLLVAFCLAILPYVVVRGPVTRNQKKIGSSSVGRKSGQPRGLELCRKKKRTLIWLHT